MGSTEDILGVLGLGYLIALLINHQKNGEPPDSGQFDVKEYLKKWVPLTPHEALPHGVPPSYSWYRNSVRCTWSGSGDDGCPTNNRNKGNWWGLVYVDTSNIHASNVRVNIWKDVKMLFLYEGSTQWQLAQHSTSTSGWGGSGYPEDFTGTNTALNKRIESDGSISYVPQNGYNSHFWPGPHIPVQTNKKVHVITIAHTRLILDNPSGSDNRSQSKYIVQVGADSRDDVRRIQRGFCGGVFIKPTNEWRTVIGSTLSLNSLNALTMPSKELFRMPDGNYPV